MAFKTCKCLCMVQNYIFFKLLGFTLSKLPLFFFNNLDKSINALILPLKLLNILIVVFTAFKSFLKIYINKKV